MTWLFVVYFFCQFVNNFSALLFCKMYFFDIFNIIEFFKMFVISRSIEILIVANFWLEVYTSTSASLSM